MTGIDTASSPMLREVLYVTFVTYNDTLSHNIDSDSIVSDSSFLSFS